MMPAPDPLAAFRAADPPYQLAREERHALEHARDATLLDARRGGMDDDALLAATGLELDELRAALARARAAEIGAPAVAPQPSSGSPDTVALTAVFEPRDEGWVEARVLEWPGVITSAHTRAEARVLLDDAVREWLLSLNAGGPGEPIAAHADSGLLEVAIR